MSTSTMMTIAALNNNLHKQVAAVCPIVGVSVGDWAFKDLWRLDFDPSATEGQKAAARAVVDAFDINDANNRTP